MPNDTFGARTTLETALGSREIARLDAIEGVENLPYSIKVLLESALRNLDGKNVTDEDVRRIASYDAQNVDERPFREYRVHPFERARARDQRRYPPNPRTSRQS